MSWEGATKSSTLKPAYVAERAAVIAAAAAGRWAELLLLCDGGQALVNGWRLDDPTWDAPLHHAARGHAPLDVVMTLIERGAWRTLPNAAGERPVDIALAAGYDALARALEPAYHHILPDDALAAMQAHLHALVMERAGELVTGEALRLPELSVLLELERPQLWFPVPGMYGGFNLCLDGETLIVESWSRVVDGSGQRHQIIAEGCTLVAEGFV